MSVNQSVEDLNTEVFNKTIDSLKRENSCLKTVLIEIKLLLNKYRHFVERIEENVKLNYQTFGLINLREEIDVLNSNHNKMCLFLSNEYREKQLNHQTSVININHVHFDDQRIDQNIDPNPEECYETIGLTDKSNNYQYFNESEDELQSQVIHNSDIVKIEVISNDNEYNFGIICPKIETIDQIEEVVPIEQTFQPTIITNIDHNLNVTQFNDTLNEVPNQVVVIEEVDDHNIQEELQNNSSDISLRPILQPMIEQTEDDNCFGLNSDDIPPPCLTSITRASEEILNEDIENESQNESQNRIEDLKNLSHSSDQTNESIINSTEENSIECNVNNCDDIPDKSPTPPHIKENSLPQDFITDSDPKLKKNKKISDNCEPNIEKGMLRKSERVIENEAKKEGYVCKCKASCRKFFKGRMCLKAKPKSQKTFICDIKDCNKKYLNKVKLDRHQKIAHPKQSIIKSTKSPKTNINSNKKDFKMTDIRPEITKDESIQISPSLKSQSTKRDGLKNKEKEESNNKSKDIVLKRRGISKDTTLGNNKNELKSKEIPKVFSHKVIGIYPCSQDGCQYKAESLVHLRYHLNSHSEDRPEKQIKCSKIENNKKCHKVDDLQTHPLRGCPQQTADSPYICDICQIDFAGKEQLKSHRKRFHSSETKISCQWSGCKQVFKNRLLLIKHMNSHALESTHSCDYPNCGKTFKTKQGLSVHLTHHKRKFGTKRRTKNSNYYKYN